MARLPVQGRTVNARFAVMCALPIRPRLLQRGIGLTETAYLVSPGVFQRYALEHPQVGMLVKQENLEDWQWMQKALRAPGATLQAIQRS